jgi:hypothetical protein
MRLNVAIPEAHVSAPILNAALEATTRLNESLLKTGQVPTFDQALGKGIKWRPEPFEDEHFDHAAEVVKRGWGDCDDLAPYHAASLRHSGEDPGATAIARRSGPKRWHAIVQRSDGRLEDPSKAAGMGRGVNGVEEYGVNGATLPLMFAPPTQVVGGAYIVKPSIAMRPIRGEWQARADLPWNWREHLSDKPTPTDYAMVSLHQDPVAATALTGAIDGACLVGSVCGIANPAHIDRLCCLSDAIDGADYHELARIYGEEHAQAATQFVGSFFKKLGKVAKGALHVATAPGRIALHTAATLTKHIPGIGAVSAKLLDSAAKAASGDPKGLAEIAKNPLTAHLVNFIPGVGPIASQALKAAMSALPGIEAGAQMFGMHPTQFANMMNVATQFPAVPG